MLPTRDTQEHSMDAPELRINAPWLCTVPSDVLVPFFHTYAKLTIDSFAAGFLLHRGRFHTGLATCARAFLSTGRHRETHGQSVEIDRGLDVAIMACTAP